jgi:cold shock CspA family protein
MTDPVRVERTIDGEVVAFDAHRGLGSVRCADGETVPFHCVAIADGSRSIEEGAKVRCVRALRFGRREAIVVERVG